MDIYHTLFCLIVAMFVTVAKAMAAALIRLVSGLILIS